MLIRFKRNDGFIVTVPEKNLTIMEINPEAPDRIYLVYYDGSKTNGAYVKPQDVEYIK